MIILLSRDPIVPTGKERSRKHASAISLSLRYNYAAVS